MGFDTSQTGGSAGIATTMPRPETIAAVGFATHGMVLENSHRVGLGRAGGAGQRIGQVPRCMAADGWRYGQGQGLHGSLVRSILEQTTTREASRVAAITLGYRGGQGSRRWAAVTAATPLPPRQWGYTGQTGSACCNRPCRTATGS